MHRPMIEFAADYQTFKRPILAALSLSKDAVHAHLGLICFLLTALVCRRSLRWPYALLPGFCLSLGMEALDLVHSYRVEGPLIWVWAWSASLHDLVNTNAPALMTYVTARLLQREPRGPACRPSSDPP